MSKSVASSPYSNSIIHSYNHFLNDNIIQGSYVRMYNVFIQVASLKSMVA